MYPVSEEYKHAISESSRSFFWTGKITTKQGKEYPFENKDIVKGSGYISRQCSGSSEIELGSVYAAELGISLFLDVDRYSLEDAEITLSFYLDVGESVFEEVPMGVFYVAEANRKIKTLELKAYDAMLNLDKNFNKGLSSAYPYDFLTLLSKACKVELAQTQEEIEALTNGTELLGIYQENDIETWRDFLYYLAQALGCFSLIDRDGKLRLVSYGIDEVKTVESKHRFTSTFSDFVTRYTAISSTNRKTEVAEYYAKDPDDGLTMNLGINPLLQFGLEETRKRILNGVLDSICKIEYVPFDSDTIGDPALDLGDILRFTGGHADDMKLAAITSITTKINGKQTIKCVGKNPKLAEAKSKNDKNISGLLNSIEETKLSVYTYTNALALDIAEERTTIVNMEFASGDETNAEFHAQCILDVASIANTRNVKAETTIDLLEDIDEEGQKVIKPRVISFPIQWNEDGKAEITIFYILDGHEVEEFHPKETWNSGMHLLTLYYPILELEANQLHTFEVQVLMKNGAGHIENQDIMATITGQGLGIQERWDGKITADDTLEPIRLSGMPHHVLGENVMVHFIAPTKQGATDHLSAITLTGMQLYQFEENIRLFTPVVHDVVEPSDRKKMQYNTTYVLDDETFNLRKDYAISGGVECKLNRGRMTKLIIPTDEFAELTGIKILPFETLPFVNKLVLYASNCGSTNYLQVVDGQVEMKKEYQERIEGQDLEINRGRLAVFDFQLENMETVNELEVTNA